ncbi:predicted protein [Plenodomus lingam JN3]|uniref:Predicted protein n=1 Tax=Leptosphaeria maculans (strain JN3 / isolate v23.1.3 / race Av1-4-5-6-7-8) TaxID=985895 RepID=E5ACJ1_LEPMJ|nr:predicted protein [Plenodomus lingam JN3]CBY02193.1 predicted protein [Plenodomus lingam JN3]
MLRPYLIPVYYAYLSVKAPPTFHPLPLSRNAHPDLSHPTPPPTK